MRTIRPVRAALQLACLRRQFRHRWCPYHQKATNP